MTYPADHQDQELRQRLSALRTDLPDGGAFRAALHQRLAEGGEPVEPSGWARLGEVLGSRRLAWPALGVAAGAAAVLLLATPVLRHAGDAAAPFGTSLQATQVAVVRLNLSADGPVDAAHIRISLPPGLAFWADGQELAARAFEWSQPLSAGDNEIPIAVRGQRPGRYRIGVDALVGGQRIQDEVLIEVTGG